MASKKDTDDRVIQHTPVHLRGDVFDERHPAASPFAVAQPAAGVVSDDADERGQNLQGGEKAEVARETWKDQKEVLKENYQRDLRAGNPEPVKQLKVDGDSVKAEKSSK